MKKISIIISIFIILLFSCYSRKDRKEIAEREQIFEEFENIIINAINTYKHDSMPIIDFSDITNFEWDKIYICSIDSDKKRLKKMEWKIVTWKIEKGGYIYVPDDINRVVFVRNDTIVQYFDIYVELISSFHQLRNKDIDSVCVYTKDEAKFIVVGSGGYPDKELAGEKYKNEWGEYNEYTGLTLHPVTGCYSRSRCWGDKFDENGILKEKFREEVTEE